MNARQAHEKAISETIRICKEKGGLQEYLEENEEQVMNIMMFLFDEQEAMIEDIKNAKYEERVEIAKCMMEVGEMTLEEIVEYANILIETVPELANDVRQAE